MQCVYFSKIGTVDLKIQQMLHPMIPGSLKLNNVRSGPKCLPASSVSNAVEDFFSGVEMVNEAFKVSFEAFLTQVRL